MNVFNPPNRDLPEPVNQRYETLFVSPPDGQTTHLLLSQGVASRGYVIRASCRGRFIAVGYDGGVVDVIESGGQNRILYRLNFGQHSIRAMAWHTREEDTLFVGTGAGEFMRLRLDVDNRPNRIHRQFVGGNISHMNVSPNTDKVILAMGRTLMIIEDPLATDAQGLQLQQQNTTIHLNSELRAEDFSTITSTMMLEFVDDMWAVAGFMGNFGAWVTEGGLSWRQIGPRNAGTVYAGSALSQSRKKMAFYKATGGVDWYGLDTGGWYGVVSEGAAAATELGAYAIDQVVQIVFIEEDIVMAGSTNGCVTFWRSGELLPFKVLRIGVEGSVISAMTLCAAADRRLGLALIQHNGFPNTLPTLVGLVLNNILRSPAPHTTLPASMTPEPSRIASNLATAHTPTPFIPQTTAAAIPYRPFIPQTAASFRPQVRDTAQQRSTTPAASQPPANTQTPPTASQPPADTQSSRTIAQSQTPAPARPQAAFPSGPPPPPLTPAMIQTRAPNLASPPPSQNAESPEVGRPRQGRLSDITTTQPLSLPVNESDEGHMVEPRTPPLAHRSIYPSVEEGYERTRPISDSPANPFTTINLQQTHDGVVRRQPVDAWGIEEPRQVPTQRPLSPIYEEADVPERFATNRQVAWQDHDTGMPFGGSMSQIAGSITPAPYNDTPRAPGHYPRTPASRSNMTRRRARRRRRESDTDESSSESDKLVERRRKRGGHKYPRGIWGLIWMVCLLGYEIVLWVMRKVVQVIRGVFNALFWGAAIAGALGIVFVFVLGHDRIIAEGLAFMEEEYAKLPTRMKGGGFITQAIVQPVDKSSPHGTSVVLVTSTTPTSSSFGTPLVSRTTLEAATDPTTVPPSMSSISSIDETELGKAFVVSKIVEEVNIKDVGFPKITSSVT